MPSSSPSEFTEIDALARDTEGAVFIPIYYAPQAARRNLDAEQRAALGGRMAARRKIATG